MRQKEEKLVVTFQSTTDAMAMERRCSQEGVPGRIVPVPRSITASCGLCWICAKEDEAAVREAAARFGITAGGYYYREMY